MTVDIGAAMHSGLALALLVVFFFYFWRQYRVDALRERLFGIRGELFDYAAAGEVSFDDAAYGQLRVLMNRMIRFAHKFTASRVVMVMLFRRPLQEFKSEYDLITRWEKSVARLPRAQQDKLRELHSKMMATIAWHLTTGSLVLFTFFWVTYLVKSIVSGKPKEIEELTKTLPAIKDVEAQALSAEVLEEERDTLEAIPA